MPIDMAPPSPNLQPFNVPPPQYADPLQTLAEMGQLRTQNLQRQGMQQEVQLRQMQMDSNKALMDSMVQSGGDYNKFFSLAAQHPGILPNDLIAARQHYMQYQQEAANYDKTTRENTAAGIDQYRGLLANVKTPEDLAAANAQADQLKIHPNVPRLTQFSDPSHVTAFSNGLATNAQILAEAKEKAATEASQATTTETGLKNVALTKQQLISDSRSAQQDPVTGTPIPSAWDAILKDPRYKGLNLPAVPTKAYLDKLAESTIPEKDLPEYRIRTGQADAMRAWRSGDPTKIDQVVDNIAPQTDPMNATTKNLLHYIVNSGGTKEEFDKAVKDLYDHRKTIATETDPRVMQARTQQAVNTEIATSPLKVQQQIATAKALRQGDNPAVAGVAPAAVGQVQNQAMKLDEQYAKEKAAAEAIGRVLDLAESGNKAAGTNLPVMGVGTLNAVNGIKRINSAEIHQYETTGSLWDQIVGKLEKITTGQPIPKDVLDDIRTLHQAMGQQSYQNYNDSLNSLNTRTGAKFAPSLGPPNARRTPGAAPGQQGGGAGAQRHFLNNREIIPKGGVWVYKDTGEKAQ